jgi:Zn-finger nucleic acid-binding protein
MPAETLNCPMCGAPASTEATQCDHCGARLATVACPSCFGMMFAGEKFCSHCGAKAAPVETAAAAKPELCPRCRVEMNAVVIGGAPLRECPHCEGIWADADALHQICEDQEKQAAVLGMAAPLATTDTVELETNIHYIPCPVCGDLMNRVNFAHCSHVIVNVCSKHGTWFDRDELRRMVEWMAHPENVTIKARHGPQNGIGNDPQFIIIVPGTLGGPGIVNVAQDGDGDITWHTGFHRWF